MSPLACGLVTMELHRGDGSLGVVLGVHAGLALLQADQAKRVCQSCPVRTACLDFALRHGLGWGIALSLNCAPRRTRRSSPVTPPQIPSQSRSAG